MYTRRPPRIFHQEDKTDFSGHWRIRVTDLEEKDTEENSALLDSLCQCPRTEVGGALGLQK